MKRKTHPYVYPIRASQRRVPSTWGPERMGPDRARCERVAMPAQASHPPNVGAPEQRVALAAAPCSRQTLLLLLDLGVVGTVRTTCSLYCRTKRCTRKDHHAGQV